MSFFAGVSASTLSHASKTFDELAPKAHARLNYWNFAQLVSLRAAKFLVHKAAQQRKRMSVGVVAAQMLRQSQLHQTVPFGVTSDGHVVFEEGDVVTDVQSGQQAMGEIVRLVDHVYAPIMLDQVEVPGLLRPSFATSLHPEVFAGRPTVAQARVTADAVRVAVDAARAANWTDPFAAVLDDYPELESTDVVRDADRLATRIAYSR
jgi:uncharacterized protein (DUF433 family)